MNGTHTTTRWHRFETTEAVARAAADWILRSAEKAISARAGFRLVLAGGRTPERAYHLLADARADWASWEIYYGDERCLPPQDPERNSNMASGAWIGHVAIPADKHHPIPAELGPEDAATVYAGVVAGSLPFDLVLLGLGEDGHTASLFPDQTHRKGELVHPVHQAPKPPPERVSLSSEALSNSREVLVLVTGSGKATAVAAWKAGASLPISRIKPPNGVDVLIEPAALGDG